MSFYIKLFLALIVILSIGLLGLKKEGNQLVVVDVITPVSIFYVGLIIFLVSSLRFEVGTDYIGYNSYARNHILGKPFFSEFGKIELFFNIFARISYRLCGDMQFLFAALSFFTVYFLFKGFLYYDKNLIVPVLIFFISTTFFISLNAMRQIAAFSIFLYASQYAISKNFKKYFLLMLLALCWHKTALLYLFLYFAPRIRIRKSFFPLVISMFIMKKIINIFLARYLSGLGFGYYLIVKAGNASTSFILISGIISVIFWKVIYSSYEEKDNFLFNIALLELLINILGDGIPGAFRLAYIFWPIYCVVCPYILRKAKSLKVIYLSIFIILFGFYFYKQQILANSHTIVPYKSILRGVL